MKDSACGGPGARTLRDAVVRRKVGTDFGAVGNARPGTDLPAPDEAPAPPSARDGPARVDGRARRGVRHPPARGQGAGTALRSQVAAAGPEALTGRRRGAPVLL